MMDWHVPTRRYLNISDINRLGTVKRFLLIGCLIAIFSIILFASPVSASSHGGSYGGALTVCGEDGAWGPFQPLSFAVLILMVTGLIGGMLKLVAQMAASAALDSGGSGGESYQDKITKTMKQMLLLVMVPYILEFTFYYLFQLDISCIVP